jgi:hypothetical protein
MPRLSQILLNLGVMLTIAGVLILSGCAATDGQATEEDVNNKSFTFPNGTVFHPALTSPTTLEFTDKANTFTLFSAGGTASGSNRFGSCILTVGTSTYAPGTGPQGNDVIPLNPCTFDSTNRTLTVSNGSSTAISSPAIARLVNATASDLNDKTFLFASGEIFHAALVNIAVTLEFTNNANSFTLTSADNTNNTASGTSTLSSGSCTLTFTSTAYTAGTGPQRNDVITLSTCQFNGSTGALTIATTDSNGKFLSITSI